MSPLIYRAKDWYGRYERPLSSASLIGGFVFDALVLKRVDLFWENFWIVVHLAVVAACIILIHLQEHAEIDAKNPHKLHFWYINILQFTFGGLLSVFIVFYFRSATLAVTWPFLLILFIAFVANESLKKHYLKLTFQISLFFLSLMSFAIFIIPVFFRRIGTDIFLFSELVSLGVLTFFLFTLKILTREKFKESKKLLAGAVFGILSLTNVLYFLKLIPPIPISLKDVGIYHSIYKNSDGNYTVRREETDWLDYFALKENFHVPAGGSAYAYSAIFSPTYFNFEIIHDWQKYNEDTAQWDTKGRIKLSAAGGRDGGYRTYSIKSGITTGEWRVNIETTAGQTLGRLRFKAIAVSVKPETKEEIKK